jgi:peroxiredoxin
MKRMFTFLFLAFNLVAARADFIIKQKVESAMQNGDMTMQIKGDKIRVDVSAAPVGDMSTIMDLSTGDSVVLMHKQKIAMKVSGAQMKQMMEAMKNQQGDSAATKPQDTGKTEKVGDYDAEIYTWSNANGVSATIWVAKDFPNYAKINEQLRKLNESVAAGMAKGMGPDPKSLPGMAVKTVAEVLGQKVTTTLVSVKEEPIDASVFEMPKDYHEMTQPAATPNAGPATQPTAKTATGQKQGDPAKVRAALVEGTKFPDFSVEDVKGNPLSIAGYKGKVVLIDFWATWDGPCKVELPNVLKTYEKYHDKGLEIIGISLDQDKGALTAFIKQNEMTWPQYFDGQVWANKLAVKYGVETIPATYLLDGEGNIIGKDLRGAALDQAVTKALAGK